MRIENLFWIGFVGGCACLLFALFQWRRVLSLPDGNSSTQGFSDALRKGIRIYLKRQLLLSGAVLALVVVFLALLVYAGLLPWTSPPALLSGGLCGLLVGCCDAALTAVGGPRSAQAAGDRLDRGVAAAFRTGAVTGFLSVGLALVHLTGWVYILRPCLEEEPGAIAHALLFFGLGSSLVALLFRMGSVFARSAGMSAEIVDREMGLSPDSPQNPVAVADRMGYGALAAGSGAEHYCTYENALLAALFLGFSAFAGQDMAWNAMLLPLAVSAVGALSCLIGALTLQPQERGDRYSLPWRLRFAVMVPALLTAGVSLPLTYFLAGSWRMCLPILMGLVLGCLVNLAGEYATSDTYRPARSLAETAEAGPAAAVTGGLALGSLGSVLPALLTAGALAAAYCLAGGMEDPAMGIYGLALTGVGLLSVSGAGLAAASCGPVGDCGAAAAALIGADEAPRRRADNLAAIGASTANGGQCVAAVSTLLSGLALLICLSQLLDPGEFGPILLPGILFGLLALFLFLGLLLLAIRNSVQATLSQARRQFQDSDDLSEDPVTPDHAVCVTRCATASLLGFLLPLLAALLSPMAAGLLLGPQGLLGFLGCVLLLSVALSLLFSLSGGVLSGARRYVESGRRGGRGSGCHRAVLTAERTMASLSQVAGPALLSFAKLAITLSLLCSALILACNLPGMIW